MSISGTISRRRIGSVSQRVNDSLPQLDIQSIQMPSNPQNALALKTAALSTSTRSLYQTCSILKKRLMCVEGFQPFLEQPPNAEPIDVVSHMCHLFRLGSPLLHLYNLLIPAFTDSLSPLYADLPAPAKLEYAFPQFKATPNGVRNWAKKPENAKPCQRYIAAFCMAMKKRIEEGRWHSDMWALHELWGKSTGEELEAYDSTGLMKVLSTVEEMLDNLPESALSPISPHTPFTGNGSIAQRTQSRQSYDLPFSMGGMGSGAGAVANMAATMNGGVHIEASANENSPSTEEMQRGPSKMSAEANAYKSVEELVASEKSYVQELEILVRCSQEMVEARLVSTETNHMIFSNLSKILDFHRKFLIKLETEYEPMEEKGQGAWAEGVWGRPFIVSEAEFDCYGPYCANYLDAITVVNEQMPLLMRGQELALADRPCLDPQRELQAFMIKPIQRITKYGLLLDAILHATAKHEYPYRPELEEASAAVKRIAAGINEVTDFKAKQATIRELVERVDDWKGHDVDKFGPLHIDDHFTVTKADQPRGYHVFLFEKMMLCCKEITPDKKKSGKNSSMLRKDRGMSKSGPLDKKKLALKGRIFVSNIKEATLLPSEANADPYGAARLLIGWTIPLRTTDGYHEDQEDSFIMIGKSEDQMKKWSEKVLDLAKNERKVQEELRQQRMKSGRLSGSERHFQHSSFGPPTPASEFPPPNPFNMPPLPDKAAAHYHGEDDDPNGLHSGRTTPSTQSHPYAYQLPGGNRRVQSQQSISSMNPIETRARAMTEDQNGPNMAQWRTQQPLAPPMPRLVSNMSGMSMASEASFGNGPPSAGNRPGMGRQMSSVRLPRAPEEEAEKDESPTGQREAFNRYGPSRGMARTPSQGVATVPHPPALRNRSASSPNVYQEPVVIGAAPPVPYTAGANGTWTTGSASNLPSNTHPYAHSTPVPGFGPPPQGGTTVVGGTAYFNKRVSSGKRSSAGSTTTTETSDQTSPATPYGTSGDLRPTQLRQGSGDSVGGSVLVKVRCGEDQFILGVSHEIDYITLYQKIQKKLRLCSSRPAGEHDKLQIRYVDNDGDEIQLKFDSDVEMMMEDGRDMAGQINLIARWTEGAGKRLGGEVYQV
ncbi:cell division control protein 24 [Cryptococcus wingfieldii CBS 7118]|uniref:Cell division control protein 24 n=1 Tax=Cryptococcus wingfieldii CBS 7118 TaxID=1295528 RepID=A0A1E3IU68_9TREE|nr:cell division control protein 24 [Cryptococcus wingfieldii CBS 7118]ODN92150.1 cell division control protein 24 [Cryptococcus wingfieldii CBS 7118]